MKTLILIFFLSIVSCKYSAPHSPVAAIDNRNRIEVLENQVKTLNVQIGEHTKAFEQVLGVLEADRKEKDIMWKYIDKLRGK